MDVFSWQQITNLGDFQSGSWGGGGGGGEACVQAICGCTDFLVTYVYQACPPRSDQSSQQRAGGIICRWAFDPELPKPIASRLQEAVMCTLGRGLRRQTSDNVWPTTAHDDIGKSVIPSCHQADCTDGANQCMWAARSSHVQAGRWG